MMKIDQETIDNVIGAGNLPSLEEFLERECSLPKDEVSLVIEYMYRILLMSYEPSDRTNGLKVGEMARELKKRRIDPDLLECNVKYEELGESSGQRKLTNRLYLLTPDYVNYDFSEHGIGSFAQLRVNLLSGWYPD